MARTIPELITEARKLLKDTRVSSYRYTDAYLVSLLNGAFGEIERLRPDAILGCCDSEEVPKYETADAVDTSKDFPLENQFFMPVVFYIVGVTELADDEFTDEGRAQALINLFRQSLVGTGG